MGSAALDSSVLSVCMSGAYTIDGADGVATGGSWGGIKTADAGYSFVGSGLECIKTKDPQPTTPAKAARPLNAPVNVQSTDNIRVEL
jgi:hypothetical protein